MRKGFTLVEIAIVLLVIAIKAAFTIRPGKNYGIEARASKTLQFIDKLQQAIDNYYDDTGGYPADTQQLWSNHNSVSGWNGPYVLPPRNNFSFTYFPNVPEGSQGTLECSAGNYLRLKLSGFRQVVCQLIDKQVDDNNLSSGRVTYDSNNHICYYYFDKSSSVKCK